MEQNKTMIWCCGNYRSGSTLIYRIIKNLIKETGSESFYKTTKVHQDWMEKFNEEDLSIYSYRDVRDAMASFCYKDKVNFETFRDHTGAGRNVIEFIKWMIDYDDFIKKYEQERPGNVIIFKYEDDIIGKTFQVVESIRKFLLILDDRHSQSIAEKLSFENAKKISDTLVQHDQSTQLHPNHLKDGKPQKYKEAFSKEQIEKINNDEKISAWLNKNGYEI
tara:strand:- start:362 stop:1021 length:660 start_codon:yes stop_codon:yes gene_type:complete